MNLARLPNAITLARMVVALPLLWLLAQQHYRLALAIAVVAGLSDVLDGFLAKRYGWQSVLGGILDPVADKLLLLACFLGLWGSDQLPTWLVAVIVGRDLLVGIGAWAWWKVTGSLQPAPTGMSKSATLAQLVLVALVMAHLAGLDLVQAWVPPLMLATAAVTVVSGLDYVVTYTWRAWRDHRGSR